jgi:hypothetical protein
VGKGGGALSFGLQEHTLFHDNVQFNKAPSLIRRINNQSFYRRGLGVREGHHVSARGVLAPEAD